MPPSFGKTLRVNRDGPRVMGPPVSAGPCAPASGSRSEQEPEPRRPQTHPPRRAGCSGRQGAPGPRVPLGPRLLRLRGLPHPEAELQSQRRGEKPSSAPARGPRGQPPDPRGLRSPLATSIGGPAPPSAQRHLSGTALAPRLDADTEWPRIPASIPNFRREALPAVSAFSRCRLAAIEPRDPDGGSPPAAVRPNAACSPSAEPSARTRRPPLRDRPRLAARRGWLPEENRAGCSAGHPRPPISGGDPSRAGTEGRGQRARGPRRGAILAPPGGRGVATARRDALTAGRSSASPLSVQRGDPHPRPPANLPWANRQEVPQFPRDPLSPTASPTLLPPCLSRLPQATASPTPQPRASPRSFTAERKNPSPP